MKTPLAWRNLTHNRVRTLAAVSGVAFSVLLIFMQLGFLGAVDTASSLVFDVLDFDLLLRSARYFQLAEPRTFARDRLHQAAAVPGVAGVSPFFVGLNQWRNPATGVKRRILVLGAHVGDQVFRHEELQGKIGLLTTPEYVLIDRKSHRDFGPADSQHFGDADIGREAEMGGRRVSIVQHFLLGPGFVADGVVVLSEEGFCRVQPGRTPNDVSLGLLRLEPGADAAAVAERLRQVLPDDVQVLTRSEANDRELQIWFRENSIGILFQVGVVVALLVGMAIVYQVLSSDVAHHLAEYATLRAIGYPFGYLVKVVLSEATALAVLGFVPGLALAEVVYWITARMANVPVAMTGPRCLGVLAVAVAMCVVSGLGALRKLRAADPADLF